MKKQTIVPKEFAQDEPYQYSILKAVAGGFTSALPISMLLEINLIDAQRDLRKLKDRGLLKSEIKKSYDPSLQCSTQHNRYALTELGSQCI